MLLLRSLWTLLSLTSDLIVIPALCGVVQRWGTGCRPLFFSPSRFSGARQAIPPDLQVLRVRLEALSSGSQSRSG